MLVVDIIFPPVDTLLIVPSFVVNLIGAVVVAPIISVIKLIPPCAFAVNSPVAAPVFVTSNEVSPFKNCKSPGFVVCPTDAVTPPPICIIVCLFADNVDINNLLAVADPTPTSISKFEFSLATPY